MGAEVVFWAFLKKNKLNSHSRYFMKNTFLKKVTVLISGTVAGRAIMACSLPVAARLYTPYDFEILAVYIAILSIMTVVSNLRFNMAISLPQEKRIAANLLGLSFSSAFIIFFILIIIIFFFPGFISKIIGQPDFLSYEWMVPFGLIFAAGYQALLYWSSRNHRFNLVAKTHITRAIGGAGSQLSLGVYGFGSFGLLLGHFIYSGVGIIGLMRNLLLKDRGVIRHITPTSMKKTLLEYRRFPIYSVPESLANVAGYQIPVIIIAAVLGPEAGYLALAMQVLAIPMSLVGQSVAQVYLAEAPARYQKGQLGTFTRKTTSTLFKVGFISLTPVGLFSPFLFPLIFGPEWGPAGYIVLWMIPWFILQFTASPVSTVLHIMGNLKYAMLLQFFGAFLRIGSVLLALIFYNNFIIEVYAVSGAVFYLIYILVILRLSQKGEYYRSK